MRISLRQARQGASLVEFAIVAPLFFLFLLGILEYARLLFTVEMLNNAAREGARFAVVSTTAVTTAEIQDYVDQYMAGQGGRQFVNYNPSSSITVYKADPTTGQNLGGSWQTAGWGDGIGITISGTFRPMMPGLMSLSSSLPLKGSCIMTSESN